MKMSFKSGVFLELFLHDNLILYKEIFSKRMLNIEVQTFKCPQFFKCKKGFTLQAVQLLNG